MGDCVEMNKLIVTLLFAYWFYLALQAIAGGHVTMLIGVTVMIVLVETGG